MRRKIVFRDEANAEIDALYNYIADQRSPEIAIAYVRRLRDACLALVDFPERGTKRDHVLNGLRTVGFERRVTIAFRVLETHVEIITIAYGGRDFEAELHKSK